MIEYLQALFTVRKSQLDERGATAVEYGLLVALIAAVIVATVVLLGTEIKGAFVTITNGIPGGTSAT